MKSVVRDWTTKAGLRAVILFARASHHCGYVEVTDQHPLYGTDNSETVECLGDGASPDCYFRVHGGVTYAGGGSDYPVEGDGWWFGYDCAHLGDKTKGDHSFNEGVFRDVDYCSAECESLAEQLVEVSNMNTPAENDQQPQTDDDLLLSFIADLERVAIPHCLTPEGASITLDIVDAINSAKASLLALEHKGAE